MYKQVIFISASFLWIAGAIFSPLFVERIGAQSDTAAPTASSYAPQMLQQDQSIAQGRPRYISVPSLGIHTTVNDGIYNSTTGQWTLSEDAAYYATPTNLINSRGGSTLIYGHNSKTIFGDLPRIKSGAEAVVTTDAGYVFTYIYQNTEMVTPTNVSVLNYQGGPRLTLQTCSGIWNESRQMFNFSLKDYIQL